MKHTLLCMPQFTLRLALGWLAGNHTAYGCLRAGACSQRTASAEQAGNRTGKPQRCFSGLA